MQNPRGRFCAVEVGALKGLFPPYRCDAARNETCRRVEADPNVYNFDSFGQVPAAVPCSTPSRPMQSNKDNMESR